MLGLAACASDPLDDAIRAAEEVPNVNSLSVRRDGALVHEAYLGGTDASSPHDVRSVTKTVTALLIGQAIDLGCIRSVDQPIGELLDPPPDPLKAAIRVRDLLSMTSGLDWYEDGPQGYNEWITADDQVAYVLAREVAALPGAVFNYNSGALHLLSAILTHACAPTATFAADHLFGPLGFTAASWEIDKQQRTNGAAGLELTNAQLAVIGQLVLDRGAFAGTQLVPADYVDQMTTPQIDTGDPLDGTPSYGFGIWLGDRADTGSFALAEGFGGQFIAVVPAARAVVVATTTWSSIERDIDTDEDFNTLFNRIVTRILPALD